MDVKNLLPIGIVVRVKDTNKEMMIIGILQRNGDVSYDYMDVFYPEGFLTQDQVFLFNHDDIEEVSYLGFMGLEHQVFRNNLVKILEEVD